MMALKAEIALQEEAERVAREGPNEEGDEEEEEEDEETKEPTHNS